MDVDDDVMFLLFDVDDDEDAICFSFTSLQLTETYLVQYYPLPVLSTITIPSAGFWKEC